MISVAYDADSLAVSRYGGIATTCYHTLRQASLHPDIAPTALYRRGDPLSVGLGTIPWERHNILQRFLPDRFDILHALCHRLPTVRARKRVYMLHDAWSLRPNKYQPPAFQKKVGARMRRELAAVDLVIVGSQAVEKELAGHNLVDPAKVTVAYQGVEPPPAAFGKPITFEIEPLLRVPYVLFVGRLETRKNILHILEAVRPLGDMHLVLVGQPGFGYENEISTGLAGFPDARLHRFTQIPGRDLGLLYRHALAGVFPSWEEGFGLPILEAMAAGCPVVTANCSAPPEVVGDSALLVDPNDPGQTREAIERLRADRAFGEKLGAAGARRAAAFTWERYFKVLASAYLQLLA
jgi:glycosyltransferase involved in cell wall biosynthesis